MSKIWFMVGTFTLSRGGRGGFAEGAEVFFLKFLCALSVSSAPPRERITLQTCTNF
jgi:hypothetical protein